MNHSNSDFKLGLGGVAKRPQGLKSHREDGFTFVELVAVIVLIGILASVAFQKMINMAEDVEITAEDATIETIRANLVSTLGEEMVRGGRGVFPLNPFANLRKVPTGYDRRRTTKPTGRPADSNLWVFVPGNRSGTVTPEQAGTTLPTFRVDGFIYHQRKDNTVVRWAYDASTGVISNKFFERVSVLKASSDRNALSRGEITKDALNQTR